LSPFVSLCLPLSPFVSLCLPLSPFVSLCLPLSLETKQRQMEPKGLPSGDKCLLCHCTVTYDAGMVCVNQYDDLVYIGIKSNHAIHIYDLIATPTEWTLKEKHTIKDGHLKPIHAMALSNDGSKLAAANERDVCL
jgi:hypothetical protein